MINVASKEQLLPDSELYKLAINDKQKHEDRRDEINKYYISLFAAIIGAIPFMDKIIKAAPSGYEGYIIRGSLTTLSLIGLILSATWALNLKRTLFYLESLDKLIIDFEKKYNQLFITRISDELAKKRAPGRVTKYQILIPYTFIVIFSCVIIYSLLWIFYKHSN